MDIEVALYNQYFHNGDEFMWVLGDKAQFRLQIVSVNPNSDIMDLEQSCPRLLLNNKFRKSELDVPLIYKILKDFERGDKNA